MILNSLHNILMESNVSGYCFCDWDGIPIRSEGDIPESLSPLVVQLFKVWSEKTDYNWREITYTDKTYHFCSGKRGILVVVADDGVNVGLIRIRAGELFTLVNEQLDSLFVQGVADDR